jgi:hypothetical protein
MRRTFRLAAAFAIALTLFAAERATAQEESGLPTATPDATVQQAPDETKQDDEEFAVPLQQYTDPENRFSFVAPANWGRIASDSSEEVTFQGPSGDNIRITIAPMEVDRKAFERAYADSYMRVLAQSFTNVKYLGARNIEINKRPAIDHVFSASYNNTPVTCHQVLLFGADKVLYITFAGYGRTRVTSEQLFLTSLASFWVSPTLAAPLISGLADPSAPGFVLPIPEGWVEDKKPDGNSFMFRPPNARPMSAFISARVTKAPADFPHATVDDAFLTDYAKRVTDSHNGGGSFEMRAVRKITLGGAPAARYDFVYLTNLGVRRAVIVMCLRDGYLVGLTCDAVEQGYPLYEQAFESLVSTFRFKK